MRRCLQCLARIPVHILCLVSLGVSLGGCYLPVARQLDAIPVPAPALMAGRPPPDCRATQTVDEATEEPSAAKTEQKGSAAGWEHRNAKLERNCYRRAEQAARASLARLQASTAGTLAALDAMKARYPRP